MTSSPRSALRSTCSVHRRRTYRLGPPQGTPEKSLRVRWHGNSRASSHVCAGDGSESDQPTYRGNLGRSSDVVTDVAAPPGVATRAAGERFPMATRTSTAGTREIEGRDSVGLYLDEIARNPLLDAETEVELSKTIEAGLMAEHLLATGRVGRQKGGAPADATEEELEWLAEEGRKAVDTFITANLRLVVSIARKYGRAADADARPDPGGQHRPDPRGREVRLHQGLQVLDVRHLVGPPGHHPRHRPAGPRRPAPRPRRRGAQPGRQRPAHARAPAGPRARARRRSPPSSAWTSTGSST